MEILTQHYHEISGGGVDSLNYLRFEPVWHAQAFHRRQALELMETVVGTP